MTKPSTTPVAGPAIHLPALDGVRGLAILLVMAYHLMLFNDKNGQRWMDSLSQVRGLGWMGVDLFFVLSGFLITGILYDTVHQAHYFRNFYMRRFLRIFPLYYGFLFLLLILTPILHVTWGGRQFVLLAYLQNTSIWFPVAGFHPADLVDLNHFWSLAVEEQFYLFWPLLVFLVKDRRRLIQLGLALSACALVLRILMRMQGVPVPLAPMHAWTICRMDTLLIGSCLALALRGKHGWISPLLAKVCFFTAMLTMLGFALAYQGIALLQNAFVGTFGYTLIAFGFAGLLVLAIQPGSLWNRFFCMAWLRSLGKYSYGIYVLHILVGYLLGLAMHALLGESLRNFLAQWLHSRMLAVLLEFAVTGCVVYAAAWLSYNLYEVYFLRLKKYFSYSRKSTSIATPNEASQTVQF